jgi:glycosyltransferase involved in cell wall biosynthesis
MGERMIVGIDYTAAAWQGAGIGRYTRELIHTAAALEEDIAYVLFYAAVGLPPYLSAMEQLCAAHANVRAVPIPLSPRVLTILWQRLRLPLRIEWFVGPLDVVHAPDFALPPTAARTLLTIHDLTFLVHPECFEPASQRYLHQVVRRSLKRADMVLADSEATRNDLARLLHVPHSQSTVVYPGVSPRFRPLPRETVEPERQRLGLPERFLLFVGTLEPRKNMVRLLEALSILYRQQEGQEKGQEEHIECPPLVVVGRKGWLYEEIFAAIERLSLTEHVHFLDFVDDETLPTLYNLAEVFVYPSLYEGFGLPVAEALACGTAVVTSHVASLPEVAGKAAVMVDPTDVHAIAEGIRHALANADTLWAGGPPQVAPFTWEAAARALITCYRAVLQK